MSNNKRYFWIKLQDRFFTSKEVRLMRTYPGGDTMCIIYQRMLILSGETDGKLYFEGIADTFAEEIALVLGEDVRQVETTINYLLIKKLMEYVDTEAELIAFPEMVGGETAAAERMRRSRARKQLEANQECNNVTPECNIVTPVLQSVTQSKSKSKSKSLELETHTERDTRARASKLTLESFDEFWKEYPNKIMQEQSASLWLSINPDETRVKEIMEGLNRWLASDQWDRGIYQSPVNWLRDKRWMDHPPKGKPKKEQAGSHNYQDDEIQDLIAQKMAKQKAART